MDDNTRVAIREFCSSELKLRDVKDAYKKQCEAPTVSRNHCYNTLVRAMCDDNLDVVEVPTGGYLRKSTVRTQCSMKPDLVKDAAQLAVKDLQAHLASGDVTNLEVVRGWFAQSLQKRIREVRTTESVSVKYVERLPASVSVAHVADPVTTNTVARWMRAREELSNLRAKHMEEVKTLEAAKSKHLGVGDVEEFMKKECVQGRPVTITNHPGKFVLKYTQGRRRNPIRETHVKAAIQYAVDELLVDATKFSASDLVQGAAKLIMENAVERAGSVESDIFTLCSRTGRKRAVDGTPK